MASDVVPQNLKVRQKVRDLRVPLAVIHPERVGEHHHRLPAVAVQPVMRSQVCGV
jgi:hypothetical protein